MKNRILPEKLIAMSSASTLSEVLSNDKETFKSDLISASRWHNFGLFSAASIIRGKRFPA